jgi:hypothetical protein
MQEVCDRLGPVASVRNWVSRRAVLNYGVFVSSKQNTKTDTHLATMTKKMAPVADTYHEKTLMFHATFDRKYTIKGVDKYGPRRGVIIGSVNTICNFIAALHDRAVEFPDFNIDCYGIYWQVNTHTHTLPVWEGDCSWNFFS